VTEQLKAPAWAESAIPKPMNVGLIYEKQPQYGCWLLVPQSTVKAILSLETPNSAYCAIHVLRTISTN
jgi:hypothetical protein